MATFSGTHLALAFAFTTGLAAGTAAVYGQGAVAATPVPPRVVSGGDVGFRIESMKGGTPVGTLVVKVNGEWVAADFSGGLKRLSR